MRRDYIAFYTLMVGIIVLSVFGVILISISGYLGGEMVFKHGVAVDQRPQTGTKL